MKKVLIVEDDIILRQVLVANLVDVGYTALEAADGEEGLVIAKEQQPDLILLDLILPGLQGLEILKRLRAVPETANIPVLVLTAKDNTTDISGCIAAGAKGYLIKANYSLDQVAKEVKSILEK